MKAITSICIRTQCTTSVEAWGGRGVHVYSAWCAIGFILFLLLHVRGARGGGGQNVLLLIVVVNLASLTPKICPGLLLRKTSRKQYITSISVCRKS